MGGIYYNVKTTVLPIVIANIECPLTTNKYFYLKSTMVWDESLKLSGGIETEFQQISTIGRIGYRNIAF